MAVGVTGSPRAREERESGGRACRDREKGETLLSLALARSVIEKQKMKRQADLEQKRRKKKKLKSNHQNAIPNASTFSASLPSRSNAVEPSMADIDTEARAFALDRFEGDRSG